MNYLVDRVKLLGPGNKYTVSEAMLMLGEVYKDWVVRGCQLYTQLRRPAQPEHEYQFDQRVDW